MVKTLVCIENAMYIRNFVSAGAFDLLSDFGYVLAEPGHHFGKLRPRVTDPTGQYVRNPHNIGLTRLANKIVSLALVDKASTFRIKVAAHWLGPYTAEEYCVATTKYPEVLPRVFLESFEPNESLQAIIREHSPELVIFPVTGVESTGTELVLLSRDYGFKTLFLINGWDNLSSKGIFLLLPDYLGVWGQQCLVDAVQIQRMPQHRCVLMGCSRYASYFTPYARCLGSPFKFPYILFAGGAMPSDEITALKICEELLAGSDTKVVYRPHPWRTRRQCFDMFERHKYKHVVIDPQVEETYYKAKAQGTQSFSSDYYPPLEYYPALLNHAKFIISPMSSMTLEAGVFDVAALILAYDDKVHPIPSSKQLEYRHFEGWEDVRGWHVAQSLGEFRAMFAKLLGELADESRDNRKYRPGLSLSMRAYLTSTPGTYAERLRDAVTMILAN